MIQNADEMRNHLQVAIIALESKVGGSKAALRIAERRTQVALSLIQEEKRRVEKAKAVVAE